MLFYGSHIWYNYRKYNFSGLRVAYNDSYRILHHIPRCACARNHQVQSNIDTLDQWFSNFLHPRHTLLPFQILRHTRTRVQIFFGLH